MRSSMHYSMLMVMMLFMCATTSRAGTGFDDKYERDYNIFTPTNRYAPDNPLNPANASAPNSPFSPINRYDPDNPANPANQYRPNNPFNPANRYHPENPFNPANQYNNVPFAPLDRARTRQHRP